MMYLFDDEETQNIFTWAITYAKKNKKSLSDQDWDLLEKLLKQKDNPCLSICGVGDNEMPEYYAQIKNESRF